MTDQHPNRGTPPHELAGMRAINWWWGCHSRTATNQLYRSRGPQDGWEVRVSHPRRRFARSNSTVGAKARKTHRVRDVLVATHRSGTVVRCTRYLCGAYSFAADLFGDTAKVCAGCQAVHTQVREVRP